MLTTTCLRSAAGILPVEKVDPGEIEMLRGQYTRAIATFEKAKGLGVEEQKTRAKIEKRRDALVRQCQ